MRWIVPVVLFAASALASALATADPRATDDVSGLVSQPAPGWKLEHWFNSEPLVLEDLRGKVVLVRWFMAPSCPLCSATAPALNRLDEEYRGRGLVVIGAYHHKDPEPLDVETVRGYVEHYQFRFPVAVDPDWQTLKRWWLDGHERSWTSVSFLIDRRGAIRHVHRAASWRPTPTTSASCARRSRRCSPRNPSRVLGRVRCAWVISRSNTGGFQGSYGRRHELSALSIDDSIVCR